MWGNGVVWWGEGAGSGNGDWDWGDWNGVIGGVGWDGGWGSSQVWWDWDGVVVMGIGIGGLEWGYRGDGMGWGVG